MFCGLRTPTPDLQSVCGVRGLMNEFFHFWVNIYFNITSAEENCKTCGSVMATQQEIKTGLPSAVICNRKINMGDRESPP